MTDIFDRNETIAQRHVNNMEFGRYFCKSGNMRGNTKAILPRINQDLTCQHVNSE